MKTSSLFGIFLFLATLFISAAYAQNQIDLPVTFEGDSTDFTLTDFEGNSSVLGKDPTDSTNTVAVITKTSGAATFAGTTIGTNLGFATIIPFTENETKISVLVHSPKAGIQVRLKVEDHTSAELTAETEATTTVANAWQKLVFDFSNVAQGTNPFNLNTNFDMASIFFDFGTEGDDAVYYFDDVYFGEGVPGSDVTLSDLFVDSISVPGFNPTTLEYAVELAEGTTEIPVVTAITTDTAATLEITHPASLPGKASIAILGSDGFTRATYTISFTVAGFVFPELTLPIDFEDGPYDFVDFDGGAATVVSNPEPSGINTSATIAKIIKGAGAPWAGSKLILKEKLDFSTLNSFSMKVFSPRADMPILFKLEGPEGAEPDNIINTTKANEWETIVWNYPDAASGTYDEIVFMFDFGTVGDGTDSFTFLFDDITQFNDPEALSKIDLPVTFEETTIDYTLTDFEGASTSLGEDPENPSNTVAITIKTNGSPHYAGTTIGTELGFASVVPFTENDTKMNVMVYSPKADIKVRLKGENHSNPVLTVETEATINEANTWENLVFDFNNVAPGTNPFNLTTNFDMFSIFFDFENDGDDAVYYWDNLVFGNTPITSNEDENDFSIPTETEIIGNYPNPFNPSTNIRYSIEKTENVELIVYNSLGRKMETIFSGKKQVGQYEVTWNASNVATGVYFIQLKSASKVSTLKVLLIK